MIIPDGCTDLFALKDKEIEELRKRLSHLMDVAGKLKDALEKRFNTANGNISDWVDEAKLALAEWDGIKEKK